MYAPFSSSGSNFLLSSPQTLDDIESVDHNLYSSVFEKIREKLNFNGDDFAIPEEINKELSLKFDTDHADTVIAKLKRDTVEIYLLKTENEIKLQEQRRLFDDFCRNISSSISSINSITINESEKDTQLKELLNERIDWYYAELGIENLVKLQFQYNLEFNFLKRTISNFSVLQPTFCTICMENEIMWFNDPCGHTLCGSCKTRLETKKTCHYCRAEKNQTKRLYL
jgi:hypothetical protein